MTMTYSRQVEFRRGGNYGEIDSGTATDMRMYPSIEDFYVLKLTCRAATTNCPKLRPPSPGGTSRFV